MPKRPAAAAESSAAESQTPKRRAADPPWFDVSKKVLKKLGWPEDIEPFSGNEDDMYRWVTEPELWASVLMGDVEARARRRFAQLHSGLHEEMHASGFVLWRVLPPLPQPFYITVRHSKSPQLPTRRVAYPAVTLKRHRLVASSHFKDGWEMRSHVGPPGKPATQA